MNPDALGDPNSYEQWVYHYTTLQTAIEHVLPSGTLRMSPLQGVNDPRESKRWIFVTPGETDWLDMKDWHAINQASEVIKSRIKAFCAVSDRYPQSFAESRHSRGHIRPRMWAQYGGNHTGVCLVFERQALHAAVAAMTAAVERQVLYAAAVRYRDDYDFQSPGFTLNLDKVKTSSLEAVISQMIDEHYLDYFFTKGSDWAGENEWRWILRGTIEGPEFFQMKDALRGIVLGCDFPEPYVPAVRPFAERYAVPLVRVHWMNGIGGVSAI